MRFRLFPSDLEGVGSYRVLYPYGAMEAFGGHDCYITFAEQNGGGKVPLQVPLPQGDIPDEFAADVYVFQRRLERWFPVGRRHRTTFGVVEVIRWLKQNNKTVVVEVDDWMHNSLPRDAPALDALRRLPHLGFDALKQSVGLADILTVSTPALAEAYGRPNTHVLPNFLNWPTWEHVEPVYDRDRGSVRVGWMGALKYRGRDLEVLRGLIGPWLRKHPEVVFVSVGEPERPEPGTNVHDYLGIPHDQRLTFPYQVFPGHAETTQEIDIGLVPLHPGLFNECKSALKGMEYAACGIPCIATPTGSYREWVEPGVNGLLARKPRQWLAALDEMLAGNVWRDMGRAARAKAEQHTIQNNWRLWQEVYTDAGPHDRHVRPSAPRALAAA